jgi:hypothetical protein
MVRELEGFPSAERGLMGWDDGRFGRLRELSERVPQCRKTPLTAQATIPPPE